MRAAPAILLGALAAGLVPTSAPALEAVDLGIVYRRGDATSEQVARLYGRERRVPAANLVAIDVPREAVLPPATLNRLRDEALARLPARVAALLLVWNAPYAAGCMSITTAFAIGYGDAYCAPGCARTAESPLFDADSLDRARGLGWRIAMLLPADDPRLAADLVARGQAADASAPAGTVYLVETMDRARNVRAESFPATLAAYRDRIRIERIGVPESTGPADVLGYFTGAAQVAELGRLRFRPGAVADHLTSIGGVLDQRLQTTALDWLRAGATGSYGTVTEPCNHTGKFPSPMVFLGHYLRGETLIEAYWKSVAMPGQGLFVGEPLAAPFRHGPG
ncbi:MAG: TIGR03790 family protein [Proteobacteria bacterium]|nr:TIGR03790 family protein [Pseudomonadota bacterium]